MIGLALVLLCIGFAHSAFFSGTETSFYRIPRIRVQIDAISGHRNARTILWLINHPTIFIATILVGNNLANNLVSMGGILLMQSLFAMDGNVGDIVTTLLLTPFLFVLGEMFPKFLALNAPDRFLRKVAPFFSFYTILFAPISIVLWGFNRCVSMFTGQKHEEFRMKLARKELSRGLEEGEYAGVLFSVQRRLTKNVFNVAAQSMGHFVRPLSSFPRLTNHMSAEELLKLARKHQLCEFPLFSREDSMDPIGYIKTFELQLAVFRSKNKEVALPIRELEGFDESHSPLDVLLLFHATGESLAYVESENEDILGLISVSELRSLMFSSRSCVKSL